MAYTLVTWIKLSTDGLAKANPGPATCEGIFRDCCSRFLGGFYQGIAHNNSSLLHNYYWCWILLLEGLALFLVGSDHFSVISVLYLNDFNSPLLLRMQRYTCLARIRGISSCCSHVFQEKNVVADNFAIIGLSSPNLVCMILLCCSCCFVFKLCWLAWLLLLKLMHIAAFRWWIA